jgi:hypothetical protein
LAAHRQPAPSSAPVSASASAPGAAADKTAGKPDGAKPEDAKAVDPVKTEKFWKDRATVIRESLARNKLVLDALQSQVNALNAEYLNTDDPGQGEIMQARIQRATGELQRVQQDIEKQTKAAADLQEEARKAGVPPGWLR